MRPLRLGLFVIVAAALAAAGVNRAWVVAQARAAAVVVAVADAPGVNAALAVVTPEPREADAVVATVPTRVFRPGRGVRWPTIVFVNGVTRRGRNHPTVRRLARALARSGFRVLVPAPPGLARGELTRSTLDGTRDVVAAAATSQR